MSAGTARTAYSAVIKKDSGFQSEFQAPTRDFRDKVGTRYPPLGMIEQDIWKSLPDKSQTPLWLWPVGT